MDTHLYRFPGGSSNQVSKVDIQDLIGYLHDEGIVYYDWNSLSGDAVDASLTPSELNDNSIRPIRNATLYCTKRNCLVLDFMRHLRNSFCHALLKKGGKSVSIIR